MRDELACRFRASDNEGVQKIGDLVVVQLPFVESSLEKGVREERPLTGALGPSQIETVVSQSNAGGLRR